MMSVLIKGMKMPKDNYVVMTLYPSGDCYLYYQGCGVISKTVKVVEVPTPHGRLIDADALLESIKEARKKDPEIEDVYIDDYFMVAEWVMSAPTIIPAEEGE